MYPRRIVAISDAQFRLGTAAGAIALIASITFVRFCGSVSLPPKPATGAGPTGPASNLVARSTATPVVYQDFLQKDAATAGVHVPSIEAMQRKFPYRSDEQRHVLEVGEAPIEIAGVRLTVAKVDGSLVLDVHNLTDSDLAYVVETAPIPNVAGCTSARAIQFNAMVISKGSAERRVECTWRDGMALAVTRVETLEVPPLSAWYLSLVPPRLVGIEDRIARAHRAPATSEKCSTVVSQVVKSGLERGQIGWRDLVDFYARHRCATYRFPSLYRAFKSDNEREVPVVDAGM